MLGRHKTPYEIFMLMFKRNNKIINNTKLKLEWYKVKEGISEIYPSIKDLKKLNTKY